MAWKLFNREWGVVDNLWFPTTEAAVFRNATIILMSAASCSEPAVVHHFGCGVGTIDNNRKGYRQRGLPGLVPRKPSRRPARAMPEYRAALQAAV